MSARQERLAKRQAKKPKPKQGGSGGGGGKQQAKPTTTTTTPAAPSRAEERAEIVFQQRQQDRQERIRRQQAADAKRAQQEVERARRQTLADRRRARADARAAARAENAAQGLRRRRKSFFVFKDARGAWRWISYSSTAFRDRDKEIVSTKALADDCDRADADGLYGPLRWWHTPGIDLGDCDFNAMHGRILIESGTFRSPAIAQKVARHAADLEISLGFFHPPAEPDKDGVFHRIRRFERSLTPRGKASNLLTGFFVKEPSMATLQERWQDAKKQFGFTDAELKEIQNGAEQREKSGDDQQLAYKAEVPDVPETPEYPDVVINGVTYKAVPPALAEDVAVEEQAEPADMGEMPMDEDEDEGGLTLSPEDLQAIGQAVGAALSSALGPLVGALDMTNKMSAHMDELKSMMGAYQGTATKKDAELAELKQTVKAQGDQLAELTGDQPAAGYRASQARDNVIATQQDTQLIEAVKAQIPQGGPWDDILKGLGLAKPNNPLA